MRNYLDTLQEIMANGIDRTGRNGSTRALFAKQLRFNLQAGFPAVTTKKLAFKAVKSELLWFLSMPHKNGRASDLELQKLNQSDKTIWTANATSTYWQPKAQFAGDLGRVYGVQWRAWSNEKDNQKIDQLANVIEKLKTNPFDRRLVVTAWNPAELDDMALPPCHMFFQFFVDNDKNLSLHMTQRSCDMFLGVPFNIASYALLLAMVAQVTGLKAHECVLTLNDAHIYHDHFAAVEEQLKRQPLPLPDLWLNPAVQNIDDFTMDDIELKNYTHLPPIKANMAV